MPQIIAAGAALLGGAAAKGLVGGMLVSTFTKVVMVGAISGAIGGAVSAALTGGNILKGALGGALIGGITAGLANKLAGVTMGLEAATGVPEVAGESYAGTLSREGISSGWNKDLVGDITNELFEEAGLKTYEKMGGSFLNKNLVDSSLLGGGDGGGLIKGIQGFWNNLGSEGKAGAMNLVGGALKGVGEWQKGKQEGKMADKAWERQQITDVPELQSRGQAQLTAPHWDRLNFSRAPEQPTSTNPYAVNMV